MCQKDNFKESRVAIFTGRVIAIGNTSNTGFINAMQSWVRTQPTLPVRKDIVVVDKNCPVYYVPASGEYCMEAVDVQVNVTKELTDSDTSNSSGLDRGVVIAVIVVAIILLIILLGLSIAVCRSSRHKIFTRCVSTLLST